MDFVNAAKMFLGLSFLLFSLMVKNCSFPYFQVLYERILSAKVNSVSGESKWRTTKDPSSDSYARLFTVII